MWRIVVLASIVAIAAPMIGYAEDGHGPASSMGAELSMLTMLPFVALLLSIAAFPLIAPHWWENNRNKGVIVAILAIPLALYLVLAWGEAGVHDLVEKAEEYAAFILLLGSLFVISGGIYVGGSLAGTPLANTGVMALGAVVANLFGTTGASMLLIRPLLRANEPRQRKVHIVVFFIFIVSNCGGLLTPLGDPPLFLGFLKGVPFTWTLGLWREWLLVNGLLLVVFHIWDQRVLIREEKERAGSQLEEVLEHAPLRVHGWHNFIFLGGIVVTIYASGQGLGNGGETWPFGVQELVMLMLAIAAYTTTRREYRENNRFTWSPIIEVAVLFAGIFVTMAPALQILNAWGRGEREVLGAALAIDQAWQFFWATGLLSSFLDNAPTYLTMAATASGLKEVATEGRYLAEFLGQGPEAVELLAAISCGAVFMGANTYIGNGPNFMVRAIAESSGVRMPGFFGYMLYSSAILLPIFVLVTFAFFRA